MKEMMRTLFPDDQEQTTQILMQTIYMLQQFR